MGLRACTARAFDATRRARHEDRVKQEAQDVPKRGPTFAKLPVFLRTTIAHASMEPKKSSQKACFSHIGFWER